MPLVLVDTVTVMGEAVAVFPAVSVAIALTEWFPGATDVLSHIIA